MICRRSFSADHFWATWTRASLTLLVSLACYEYRPDPRPQIGTEVQLALTDSGAATLAPLVGTAPARLEGRLNADSSGVYSVLVNRIIRPDGSRAHRGGEQMIVPHALVATVTKRQLSRRRSLLAGSLVGAVALGVADLIAHQRITTVATGTGGKPTPR